MESVSICNDYVLCVCVRGRKINCVLRSKDFNLGILLYRQMLQAQKDEQMGEPQIVHQVPVLVSSVFMHTCVCVFVCVLLVHHILSLCGRLTSSRPGCSHRQPSDEYCCLGVSVSALCECVCAVRQLWLDSPQTEPVNARARSGESDA